MNDLDNRMVGAGVAIGAGVGATAAILAEASLALGAGYGAAAGIVLGTVIARIAPWARDADRTWLSLVGGALVAGAIVGGIIGTLAAWSADGQIAAGLQVGMGGGLVLAILLAGVAAGALTAD